MLGSYRFFILIKLILYELPKLKCIEDTSFHLHSSNNPPVNPIIMFVTVSVNDYFAVINCTTPERVPHHKLDWYFQTRASLQSPRVIWQRGRSNIHRYVAYSPDQFRHFLQIKPLHYNDSGTYLCLDQTTGFYTGVELTVEDTRSCAGNVVSFQMTTIICLILLILFLSRHTASDSQVT